DQEHLVDVELAAEAATARAVDRDGVLVVRDGPAQLAAVRAVSEPAGLAKEAEDLVAAVVLARDGYGSGHAPDGVLGDHLDERPRVAAHERGEDAPDVVGRAQRSSGAIVRPKSSSCEW